MGEIGGERRREGEKEREGDEERELKVERFHCFHKLNHLALALLLSDRL